MGIAAARPILRAFFIPSAFGVETSDVRPALQRARSFLSLPLLWGRDERSSLLGGHIASAAKRCDGWGALRLAIQRPHPTGLRPATLPTKNGGGINKSALRSRASFASPSNARRARRSPLKKVHHHCRRSVQRPFMSARPRFRRITSLAPKQEMSWNAVIF